MRFSITPSFGDTSWVGGGNAVVEIGAQNVVFDGFFVWGQIGVSHNGDFSTIKNCDLSGGNGGRDNFSAVIYLHMAQSVALHSTIPSRVLEFTIIKFMTMSMVRKPPQTNH